MAISNDEQKSIEETFTAWKEAAEKRIAEIRNNPVPDEFIPSAATFRQQADYVLQKAHDFANDVIKIRQDGGLDAESERLFQKHARWLLKTAVMFEQAALACEKFEKINSSDGHVAN